MRPLWPKRYKMVCFTRVAELRRCVVLYSGRVARVCLGALAASCLGSCRRSRSLLSNACAKHRVARTVLCLYLYMHVCICVCAVLHASPCIAGHSTWSSIPAQHQHRAWRCVLSLTHTQTHTHTGSYNHHTAFNACHIQRSHACDRAEKGR